MVVRCSARTLAVSGYSVKKTGMLVRKGGPHPLHHLPSDCCFFVYGMLQGWHMHLHIRTKRCTGSGCMPSLFLLFMKGPNGPVPRQHAPAALLSDLRPKHTHPRMQTCMHVHIFNHMHASTGVHAQPERTGHAPAAAEHGRRHDGPVLPPLRTNAKCYVANEGSGQKRSVCLCMHRLHLFCTMHALCILG